MAAHGEWGEEAIRLLRVEPFCSVGKWGLQLFVYQAASHTLVEGVLATLHLGIHTRCATQPMALPFASVYVTAHVAMTYFVAWLMTNNGPIGKHIHAWAGGHAPS
ncbi:hypothetical protein T484DRAFT_1795098 [Baffinella frigidus]|nr:hypothetical protein T484DRAFT_1795098 [Cryptophyta sp. CCMP2293]